MMHKHYTVQAKEAVQDLPEFTEPQLWAIAKLCKIARRSCRHNTAFNNMMNAAFPYANFAQVEKTNVDGSIYEGLRITVKDDKQITLEDKVKDLQIYLTSSKFYEDTTVQVADVLRRLELT